MGGAPEASGRYKHPEARWSEAGRFRVPCAAGRKMWEQDQSGKLSAALWNQHTAGRSQPAEYGL